LIVLAKPVTEYGPAHMDYRGLVLIASGVALSVLGFQQASPWGWSYPGTWLCIAGGLALLVVFGFVESRTRSPLIEIGIFKIRAFLVENVVLGIAMLAFIPIFFFASEYAQISLGKSASGASLVLLYFFAGFVTAAQIGGRMLDRVGAKRPVVVGCVLAAVGFDLWAGKVDQLDLGNQIWCIILAGAGMGMMLGPASTDAVNRASKLSYGEATGITQTVRNYSASLGLAILGTLLVDKMHSHVKASLVSQGLSPSQASSEASHISQSQGGAHGAIPHFVQLDFAYATRSVLLAMAAVMAVAAVVALFGLRRGLQAEPDPAAGAQP
jgi:predicted MFS family arabinose efflux permease